MKMKRIITTILFAFAIFATANTFAANNAEIDKSAPDFTLMDSYGKTHKLSDFIGKTVVLEWVNFDCPFVVKHYSSDNMQNIQKKYTEKGVIWLSICSSAEGKQGHFKNDEINKRIKDRNAKMTHYLIDEDGSIGKLYNAKTTPHMYIIDKNGILIYAGAIDDKKSTDKNDIPNSKNFISVNLDKLLNGEPLDTKTTVPYGCSVKYK
jgi:peroxiredoxin